MTYRKYFFTPTQWKTAKRKTSRTYLDEDNNEQFYWDASKVLSVIELGHPVRTPATYDEEGNELTAAVLDSKIEVDILWATEPPKTSFAPYEVWPAPCGRHIIAGWESAYINDLYTLFPERMPVSDDGDVSQSRSKGVINALVITPVRTPTICCQMLLPTP